MALILNEEQTLLKESAKKLLTKHAPISDFRMLRDNPCSKGYSTVLWEQMVDSGWPGIIIPQHFGGSHFGYAGLGVLLEQTGRHLCASPLFSTTALCTGALVKAGSNKQKDHLLPEICSGKITLALAHEEDYHHKPLSINLSAQPYKNGFLINGKKNFVLDGNCADYLIITSRTHATNNSSSGITLFLVPADTLSIQRKKVSVVDSRNVADIVFDNVYAEESCVLGTLHDGWPLLENTLDTGRICLAAEMLGGAQECFERTVHYLKEREQFGVKIGSFQALQHRAAKMIVELELCRSVVLDALSAIDENRNDLPLIASLAKTRLNDVYELICCEAIQMHGGIGITDELDIGLFLKRATVCAQLFGDSGFHKDRYASLSGY